MLGEVKEDASIGFGDGHDKRLEVPSYFLRVLWALLLDLREVAFLKHIYSFASAINIFFDKSDPGFRGVMSTAPATTPTRLPRAALCLRTDPAIWTSLPLVPSPIPTWASCPVADKTRLLAAFECPEGSVVSCVDGILASACAGQTCEEA